MTSVQVGLRLPVETIAKIDKLRGPGRSRQSWIEDIINTAIERSDAYGRKLAEKPVVAKKSRVATPRKPATIDSTHLSTSQAKAKAKPQPKRPKVRRT